MTKLREAGAILAAGRREAEILQALGVDVNTSGAAGTDKRLFNVAFAVDRLYRLICER